ncbi:hypothetical protein DRO97_05945 [Archaeoglobales archaeon]|nr:MAG: hypothetical protein DRO97_05945 [Archaeoglobales archaeon]
MGVGVGAGDITPPTASNETPADGSYINNATPTISVDITDSSGVNGDSINMTVNSISVTPTLTIITNGYHVEYTSNLTEETMTVSVTAEDLAESPNTIFYNWSFTIDITPPTISNVNISDVTSSGITDANGQVSLESDQVKNPPTGTTFTFVVDNVVKEGWTYDSSLNVETSDSITV